MARICFVAPAAWSILSGDTRIASVGGAEVQQCILARGLVRRGHEVSMICHDHGQRDGTVVDGITVHVACSPTAGIPRLRFVHPRFTSLWSALWRADAKVYYQRTTSEHTGYTAAFCRLRNRKFIYAAAHNTDFDPRLSSVPLRLSRPIVRWGLRRADTIVAQNPVQARHCQLMLGRTAELVRSCYLPPQTAHNSPNGYVLWVSTLRDWKRPERFLELARRLPKHQFRMVGGPGTKDDSVYGAIHEAAAKLGNVEFLGFVPYSQIETHFNGARIFVNTSDVEGFPNTFLQAWARAIPTVSMFDPGFLHDGRNVVVLSRDVADMAAHVERLMTHDDEWRTAGRRSFECYQANHSVDVTVAAYDRLLSRLS